MATSAYSRRFGVEIECGLPGGSSQGIELFPHWSVGRDGSGVEIRTPILVGARGRKTLRQAMEKIKRNGGYVTHRDGMHVHHDAPEFRNNPAAVRKLVDSWINNEEIIYSLVHPDRRREGGPAPKWHSSALEALRAWEEGRTPYLSVGRYDLNVASLRNKGSIEIRLHEGTLDADVALAWIKFGQKFIHDVLKRVRPLTPSKSDKQLMSRIRLSPTARAMLAEKQARGHVTLATNRRGYNPY